MPRPIAMDITSDRWLIVPPSSTISRILEKYTEVSTPIVDRTSIFVAENGFALACLAFFRRKNKAIRASVAKAICRMTSIVNFFGRSSKTGRIPSSIPRGTCGRNAGLFAHLVYLSRSRGFRVPGFRFFISFWFLCVRITTAWSYGV